MPTHNSLDLNQPGNPFNSYYGLTPNQPILMPTRYANNFSSFRRVRFHDPQYTEPTKNPMLAKTPYPLFDEIQAHHIVPAMAHVWRECEQRLLELEASICSKSTVSWDDVIEPLSLIDNKIATVYNPASHLKFVQGTPAMNKAFKIASVIRTELKLRIMQSKIIYKALRSLRNGDQWQQLEEWKQRALTSRIRTVQLAGIDLEESGLKQFNAISKNLQKLYLDFGDNITRSKAEFEYIITDSKQTRGMSKEDLKVFSTAFHKRHPEQRSTPENGPWLLSQDNTSKMALFIKAEDRTLRQEFFEKSRLITSSSTTNNTPLIDKILQLRLAKARLLQPYLNKVETFADLNILPNIAGSVEEVDKMHERFYQAVIAPAQTEALELQEYAESLGFKGKLEAWDIKFYEEKLKKEHYDYNNQEIKDHITFDRAIEGLFETVSEHFPINILEVTNKAPINNDHVRYFEIYDLDDNHIAAFYIDPYRRPGEKKQGVWHMSYQIRHQMPDGTMQTPISIIGLDVDPPVNGESSGRMTMRNLGHLFHEFGHALQNMVTTQISREVAGLQGIEQDATEVPSQFLERFAYQRSLLEKISNHKSTGKPLPQKTIDRIIASRNFRAYNRLLWLILFGMIDIDLHHRYDPNESKKTIHDVWNQLLEERAVYKPTQTNFDLNETYHFFGGDGYASRLYAYLWSDQRSADLFSVFDAAKGNTKATQNLGARLMETLFGMGGGRHFDDVIKDFLGRTSNPEALLQELDLS